MSRPWSALEVEEKIPEMVGRMEDAIADLKSLGEDAATKAWAYRRAKAIGFARTSGKNAELREANCILHQIEPGKTVADLGLARDLAENAYVNQRQIIAALRSEADLMRTLVVSARNEGQGR